MWRKARFFGILLALKLPGAAQAALIVQPVDVWTDGAYYFAPTVNVINQSGLSQNYVSGVDDFNTFVSGTSANYNNGVDVDLGDTSAPLDNYYFDLGMILPIDAMAIWNQSGSASLNTFDIYSSVDSTFTTTTYLGSYSIPDGTGPGYIYNFGQVSAQYFMIDVTSNYGFTAATRINEVAFSSLAPIPEPPTIGLLGIGLVAILWRGIRNRSRRESVEID